MFRLGAIEESLKNKNMLETLRPYFYSQRIDNVSEDVKCYKPALEFFNAVEKTGPFSIRTLSYCCRVLVGYRSML